MGTAAVETLGSFATLGVSTDLTAHTWRVTLIGVNTRAGVIQRLATWTRAQWTLWSLDTTIGASGLGATAIIQVTVRTLISAIRTVSLSVTDAVHRDADVRGVSVGTSPCALTAGYLDCRTGVDVLVLVTTISTVICTITHVGMEDTLVIVTFEVIRRTGHGTTRVRFITFILTISSSVTVPTLG